MDQPRAAGKDAARLPHAPWAAVLTLARDGSSWRLLLILVLCAVAVVLLRGRAALDLLPLNCAVLRDDGVCELAQPELRLYVDAPPRSRVWIFRGQGVPAAHFLSEPRPVPVIVPLGPRRLVVLALYPGGAALRTVQLLPPDRAPWLVAAMRATGGVSAVEQATIEADLKVRSAGPLSPRERAEVALVRGFIASDQRRLEDAKEHLRRAIPALRAAGLRSRESVAIIQLADIIGLRQERPAAALAFLNEHAARLEATREHQPFVHSIYGRFHAAIGDLAGALALAEEGERWAQRFDDQWAKTSLSEVLGAVLPNLGRTDEADGLLRRRAESTSGCARVALLAARADLRLTRWLALRPSRDVPMNADPRPLLVEALAVGATTCADQHLLDGLRYQQAWAALLAYDPQAAVRAVPIIERGSPAELSAGAGSNPMRLRLAAELALQRGEVARAAALLAVLRTPGGEEPACDGALRTIAQLDRCYEVFVGLGRLHEADAPDEAVRAYERAEDILDGFSELLPFELGRGAFLGRHEGATKLLLDLLDRLGRPAEAMARFRHARIRGLRTLQRFALLDRLDTTARARWEAATRGYQETNARLAALPAGAALEAHPERDQLRAQRAALETQLLRQMEAAQAVLTAPSGTRAGDAAPPGPAELLLGCHALTSGFLCLAQGPQGTYRVRLPALGAADLDELLRAFAAPLARARTVRVLGHGPFRDVAVHQLPFQGAPLGARRAVVYALDLPELSDSARAAAPHSDALRVLPYQGAVALREGLAERAQADLAAALRGANLVSSIGSPGGSGEAGPLLPLLPRADLLLYLGHGSYAPLHGQARLFGDGQPVLVSDLLTAPALPRYVVLLACEGGAARESSGGLEGLSLAAAFLLRGSAFVIAAPAPLPADAAALLQPALVTALHSEAPSIGSAEHSGAPSIGSEEHSGAPSIGSAEPDPVAALRRVQALVESGALHHPAVSPARLRAAVAALRVHVP